MKSLTQALEKRNKDNRPVSSELAHRPVSIINVARSIGACSITTGPISISKLIDLLLNGSCFNYLTHHYDNTRTGWNPYEEWLTVNNVTQTTFGVLFQHHVDGDVYTQPLYVENLHIVAGGVDKGVHDVIFIATENNSVYAFDADSNTGQNSAPLWVTTVNHADESAVPHTDLTVPPGEEGDVLYPTSTPPGDGTCTQPSTSCGITSTPVIDLDAKIIYVVAKIKNTTTNAFITRLTGLDIRSGNIVKEKEIAPPPGSYPGIVDADNYDFSRFQFNRPGLLLNNGIVYIAFACHCDISPYFGWIFAYDVTGPTIDLAGVINTNPISPDQTITPNRKDLGGGIWMSGFGLACDYSGNIYCSTGNGKFNANDPTVVNKSYSDSIIRISTLGGSLEIVDYFTPHNQQEFHDIDLDVAAGGVMLLPDSSSPPLLVCCGKFSTVYLINRDNMGGFNRGPPSAPFYGDNVVQPLPNAVGSLVGSRNSHPPPPELPPFVPFGIWGGPAYFKTTNSQYIYYAGHGDNLKAFKLLDGLFVPPFPAMESGDNFNFDPPTPTNPYGSKQDATPSVSSNGTTVNTGIIWVVSGGNLHAYDAANLANKLGQWSVPSGSNLITPTIINGKVYVGCATYTNLGSLTVLGLL